MKHAKADLNCIYLFQGIRKMFIKTRVLRTERQIDWQTTGIQTKFINTFQLCCKELKESSLVISLKFTSISTICGLL